LGLLGGFLETEGGIIPSLFFLVAMLLKKMVSLSPNNSQPYSISLGDNRNVSSKRNEND
jgi:hypothetical protein